MRRISLPERPNWRLRAAELGFNFHSTEGVSYWDETACYIFSLKEIENDIEAATEELAGLCYEAVPKILANEELLQKLRIPEFAWDLIAHSWQSQDKDLYGRFDLRYDGATPPKLYEYNADTPTGLYEAAVFQWHWLEDIRTIGHLPSDADQFNAIHERLIEGFGLIGQQGALFHFACSTGHEEDRATVSYLEDCAQQASLDTAFLFMEEIGLDDDGRFVDKNNRVITHLFKLYPWEWLLAEKFGTAIPTSGTCFVEPPWKLLLSNKGLLAVLWALYPNHPNLLPAYFEDDPKAAELSGRYARKPIYGREGANVQLIGLNESTIEASGPYGSEGYVHQALAPLPNFSNQHPVIGSWWVAGYPAGIGIREENSLITTNGARFLPHAIVDKEN